MKIKKLSNKMSILKLIVVPILFLVLYCDSFAAKVPNCWLKSSDCPQNIFAEDQFHELDESLDQIFEMKSNLVETVGKKIDHQKKYYLASIKTVLGLEVSGEIGIIEAGGEAALELIWSSQKPKNNFLGSDQKFQDEYFDHDNSLDLSNVEVIEDIKPTIENLGNQFYQNGKIENKNLFIKTALLEINKVMGLKKIMDQNPDQPWWPYKFQLELLFQADGLLANGATVGSGFVLKLGWHRLEKKKQFLLTNKLSSKDQSNADVLNAMGLEFEKAYLNYQKMAEKDKTTYDLNNIKIGIGFSAKGDVFVAKAKSSVLASVFYKRANLPRFLKKRTNELKNEKLINIPFGEDKNSFMSQSLKPFTVRSNKFGDGLNKMMKAAHYFSKKAQQRNDKFKEKGKVPKYSLNFIEIELEVFSSGDVGLTTLKGISEIELFLTKIN